VLNVNGYYDGLAGLFDHAVDEGFIRPQHREALHFAATPADLLDRFAGWEPTYLSKWTERDA
jgi:predicted Rossmann-fold nucleotide-binding protein